MVWLGPDELRIGLGCMRLPDGGDEGDEAAEALVGAALAAGITIFDTARAYGDSERRLGRVLRGRAARVITKGGMARPGGRWVPDGRAAALRADCEASLAALGGVAIDLYLLHAPDPRTPWQTSLRALRALVDAGLVRRVGVCNVNRRQLDEAIDAAPIAAVQVAVSPLDGVALRGGVVARCVDAGIPLLAHSPLGGPARVARLGRDPLLVELGTAHGTGAAEAALAWLLALHPLVVAIPGARRVDTVRACAQAARIALSPPERERLEARFSAVSLRPPERFGDGEVALLMGLQGAGKTEAAATWVARGYERLNRDERGGTLRQLARALDERLAAGARRVVLDNTYVSRAARRDVIEAAWRHGVAVRCVWLDTPAAQAQINVVLRMLAAHGRLLEPEEMERADDPSKLPPNGIARALRELEPPAADEGFATIEVVPFGRRPRPAAGRGARFVALEALGPDPATALRGPRFAGEAPVLVFAWRPGGLAAPPQLPAHASFAVCPHPAGPPRCWCRPPMPGLPLAFAHAHGVDLAASVVVGGAAAHRAMAAALGAAHEPA